MSYRVRVMRHVQCDASQCWTGCGCHDRLEKTFFYNSMDEAKAAIPGLRDQFVAKRDAWVTFRIDRAKQAIEWIPSTFNGIEQRF